MVAALYIDPRGPYPKMADVDAWDVTRDARLYDGPHPVVCHPPCGPWGKLRHLYSGEDRDCAIRAVEQVRAFGGVLEHPAGSMLWADQGLPMSTPENTSRDAWGGYSIEVEQVRWGHPARKRTWLYLVGVPTSALVWPPPREPTHWVSGATSRSPQPGHNAAPPGMKILLGATAPPHAAGVRGVPGGAGTDRARRGGGAVMFGRYRYGAHAVLWQRDNGSGTVVAVFTLPGDALRFQQSLRLGNCDRDRWPVVRSCDVTVCIDDDTAPSGRGAGGGG